MTNKISSSVPRSAYQFNVTYTCDTPGAVIRVEEGELAYPPKDPDENSPIASQSQNRLSEGTIIKAKAFKDGLEPSEVAIEEIPLSSTLNETSKLLNPVLTKDNDGWVYIKNIAYYGMYTNYDMFIFAGDSEYTNVENDSASFMFEYNDLQESSEVFTPDSFPFYIKATDSSGDHEPSDIIEIK